MIVIVMKSPLGQAQTRIKVMINQCAYVVGSCYHIQLLMAAYNKELLTADGTSTPSSTFTTTGTSTTTGTNTPSSTSNTCTSKNLEVISPQ